MNISRNKQLKRLEARINHGKGRKTYTHFEGEALPDSYDPAKDRVITYVETDMRVYPDAPIH